METAKTQQVPKASSDELLRKFADSGDEGSAKEELKLSMKRRKRSRRAGEVENCESPTHCSSGLVERKSLLPPTATTRKSTAALLRIGRSKLRARNFKNKSILGTIEKTWRRTVEGASKVFIEKHYNRHKRLINDAV